MATGVAPQLAAVDPATGFIYVTGTISITVQARRASQSAMNPRIQCVLAQ